MYPEICLVCYLSKEAKTILVQKLKYCISYYFLLLESRPLAGVDVMGFQVQFSLCSGLRISWGGVQRFLAEILSNLAEIGGFISLALIKIYVILYLLHMIFLFLACANAPDYQG